MLEELSKYENLGTPRYYIELIEAIGKSNKNWTIKEIHDYFYNRIIEGRSVFDGCMSVAEYTGIIQIDNRNNQVIFDPEFIETTRDEGYLCSKFLKMLFVSLKQDVIFHKIFHTEVISLDIVKHYIQISNSAFSLKYSNIKQLLLDFRFLLPHPDTRVRKLIINSKYKKLFDKELLPEIKKRKISADELNNSLKKQQLFGEEAEIFVLEYEKNRLCNKSNIEWIANYWVNAGYDIASFCEINAKLHDRFIEVKSYSGKESFFWSRNEIEVARQKKNAYFLYLVDRSRLKENGYTPIIIKNPYATILKNESGWKKRVEKYYITK